MLSVLAIPFIPLTPLAATRRSDDVYHQANRDIPFFFASDHQLSPSDATLMHSSNLTASNWDKVAGELVMDFEPQCAEHSRIVHSFYPRCAGLQNGKVVDNEGHEFALDYWTPNGTLDLYLPEAGWVTAKWLMEIGDVDVWDCRDRYEELPAEVSRPTPKVLTQAQQDEIEAAKQAQEAEPSGSP